MNFLLLFTGIRVGRYAAQLARSLVLSNLSYELSHPIHTSGGMNFLLLVTGIRAGCYAAQLARSLVLSNLSYELSHPIQTNG